MLYPFCIGSTKYSEHIELFIEKSSLFFFSVLGAEWHLAWTLFLVFLWPLSPSLSLYQYQPAKWAI